MGGICQSEAGGLRVPQDEQGSWLAAGSHGSAAHAGGKAFGAAGQAGAVPPLSPRGLPPPPTRVRHGSHFAPEPFGFHPKATPRGPHAGGFPGAESYTLRLLVLPLGGLGAAGAMTVLNTVWELEAAPVCLFFSDVLNDPKPEPWTVWALRWVLCFTAISSTVEFKRTYLPRQVHWVLLFQWLTFLVAMLTGFRQIDPPQVIYACMYKVHQIMAMLMFIELWLETVMLWCPSPLLHAIFMVTVPINVITFAISGKVNMWTGIPYVYGHPEIILEWFIILAHFVIVWIRFPAVSTAIAHGTWRPWLCCFAGLCPGLATQHEQVQCGCPPGLGGTLGEAALLQASAQASHAVPAQRPEPPRWPPAQGR